MLNLKGVKSKGKLMASSLIHCGLHLGNRGGALQGTGHSLGHITRLKLSGR